MSPNLNNTTSEGLPAVAPRHGYSPEPAPHMEYDGWDRSEDNSGSTMLHFLQLAFRKWSWLVIPTGVLLAIAGAATVWLLYQPEYLATGWVRMRTDVASVSIATDKHSANGAASLLQPDLIVTPFVVGPVLSRAEIANLPEILEEPSPQDWLPSKIQVVADGLDVMRIQYKSVDAAAARKIVDAVVEEYERVHVSDSRGRISRQLAEIKNQLRSTQAMINESNRELASLLPTMSADSLSESASGALPPDADQEMRMDLRRRLAEANFRQELAREKMNAFLGQNLGQLPSISADEVRAELAKHFDPIVCRKALQADRGDQADLSAVQLEALVEQERKRQSDILRERLELTAACKQVAEQAPKSSPELVRKMIDNHPEVVQLDNLLRGKQNELQAYRARLSSRVSHAGVKKLMADVRELEESRNQLHTYLTEQAIAEYDREAQESVLERFNTLVAEMNDIRVEQTVLTHRLSQVPRTTTSVAGTSTAGGSELSNDNSLRDFVDSSKMETIRKELAAKLVVLEELVRQELVLTMQSGLRDSQLATIPATISSRPVNARPYRNMFLATLFGLALPCGLGMLWEWQVKRVTDAEQFTAALGLPVLGEIARIPNASRGVFVGSEKSAHRDSIIYEQSTLVLSDNISHSRHLRNVKVMSVSSAVKGEGKSHLAVKLAVNLARVLKGNVLLVDGDIRFRTAERLLGVAPRVGLSELLRGESTIDEAIDDKREDGLHILTAGGPNDQSFDQLRNGVLTGIFTQLRARYKYIIIDSPPILSAGESLSLGKVADGTLICALRDVSRVPLLQKAISRLESVGVRPIGAILAGVPASHYENSYYAYSHAGHDIVTASPLPNDGD